MAADAPPPLAAPALVDTAVWTWVRDRRRPDLAEWFNGEVAGGRVLICELVMVELARLAPNAQRARATAERLSSFGRLEMPDSLWCHVRQIQLDLAETGDHRSVPPADLLIAATALEGEVELLHYDGDYEAVAAVTDLRHRWLVERGEL